MSSSDSLFQIKTTLSALLAASAQRLFPGVILLGGEATSKGFYYDFIFPDWEKRYLTLLQEQMFEIIRKKCPVTFLEMVPKSASGFFSSSKQPILANVAKQSAEPLLSFVQIDGFVDFSKGEYVQNTSEVPSFFLQETFPLRDRKEKGAIRIFGYGFLSKEESKKVDRKNLFIGQKDHILLGRSFQYFMQMPKDPTIWAWLPSGEKIKEKLYKQWREKISSYGYQVVSTSSFHPQDLLEDHQALYKAFARNNKLAEISVFPNEREEREGMFSPSFYHADRLHLFCTADQVVSDSISSLQFISEILSIFSWKYSFVLSGKPWMHNKAQWKKDRELLEEALSHCKISYRIDHDLTNELGPVVEARIEDKMGKEHACSFVCIHKKEREGQSRVVIQSVFGLLERFVALLIEEYEGLPFWLHPEQVRLLSTGEKSEIKALELKNRLSKLGFSASVDREKALLAKRISQAEEEKIPFIVTIEENDMQQISVRNCGAKNEEMINIEVFIEKLCKNQKLLTQSQEEVGT